jgi:hypothetical protein
MTKEQRRIDDRVRHTCNVLLPEDAFVWLEEYGYKVPEAECNRLVNCADFRAEDRKLKGNVIMACTFVNASMFIHKTARLFTSWGAYSVFAVTDCDSYSDRTYLVSKFLVLPYTDFPLF